MISEILNYLVPLLLTMGSVLAWRKVLLSSSTLTDNAASFVNQTARRLHLLRTVHRLTSTGSAAAIGDNVRSSLDEQPVAQASVNDSRSHISAVETTTVGGTGVIDLMPVTLVLDFPRNALVMDSDDAIFLNNTDVSGAVPADANVNIWYDD